MNRLKFLPIIVLIIVSCGDDASKKSEKKNSIDSETDYSFQSKAVQLISNEENIMLYGSIKMNQILTKGLFNSKMGESSLIKEGQKELDKLAEAINMNAPLYYAVQMGDNAQEPGVLLFGKTEDHKKFIDILEEQNPYLDKEESNNYSIITDGDIAAGIGKEEFVIKVNPDRNAKKEINKLMTSLQSEKTNANIESIFSKSKDFTMAYNLKTLIKMIEKTNPEIQQIYSGNDYLYDQLETAAMDLSFEKGAIKLIYSFVWGDELKEFNFYKDNSNDVVAQLGTGEPVAAFAANIDVEKIEAFRKKYAAPGIIESFENSGIDNIEEMIPNELIVAEALMDKDGIKSFIDGRFGAAVFMNEDNELGIPEFNFLAGIGPNLANMIREGIEEFAEMEMFVSMMNQFTVNDEIVSGYSSKQHAPDGKRTLITDKFQDFGKKPFSAFVDFSKIPKEGLLTGIDRSLSDFEQFLDIIDAMTMEFDMSGGHMTIYTKDPNKNALTYIMDRMSEMISNMPALLLNSI